jgi:hypothetical protein
MAGNVGKRITCNAGGRLIADRGTNEHGRRATKTAIAAEHQNLCGALVDDCKRIALAISGFDDPSGERNHRLGYVLVWGKLIGGGSGRSSVLRARVRADISGFSYSEARQRQRE